MYGAIHQSRCEAYIFLPRTRVVYIWLMIKGPFSNSTMGVLDSVTGRDGYQKKNIKRIKKKILRGSKKKYSKTMKKQRETAPPTWDLEPASGHEETKKRRNEETRKPRNEETRKRRNEETKKRRKKKQGNEETRKRRHHI